MFHKLNKNKQQAFDLANLWLDKGLQNTAAGSRGEWKRWKSCLLKKKSLLENNIKIPKDKPNS